MLSPAGRTPAGPVSAQDQIFFFGAIIMTIWRPSRRGRDSMTMSSPRSASIRDAISRPRLLVAHFTATEADVDLDLVALFQEAAHVAQLDLVVALVGNRTELEFLDLDLLGLLLGLVGLFLLLELELAEIHDLADRRIGLRLDFDQIQAFFLGLGERFVARQHADHLTVTADHADARHTDFLVLAVLFVVRGTDIAISQGESNRRIRIIQTGRGWLTLPALPADVR